MEANSPQIVPAKKRGPDRKYIPTQYIDDQLRKIYFERCGRRNSPIPKLADFAAKIGWPPHALKKRAVEIGIARTKEKPWSEAELRILEKYAHYCDSRISRKLAEAGFQRSDVAVHLKIKRMRFKENTPYYSMAALAGLFGVDPHTVSRWVKFGYLQAKPKGTKRIPQQGGDSYLIHHRHVREFVVDHPTEFDIRKVDQLWFINLLTNKEGAM
jgi:hypothetical protein